MPFFQSFIGKTDAKKDVQTIEKATGSGKQEAPDFEGKWKYLQQGFNKLIDFLDKNMSKPFDYNEYADLYSTVFNLCTQKVDTNKKGGATELLYDRYRTCISDYLKSLVVVALKEKQGDGLLMEAVKRWRDHQLVVRYMVKLYNYLDRYYTKHNNRDDLRNVGLKCYQELVYGSIKKDMAQALLDKIYKEREGDLIDRSMMKDGITLFIEMGLGSLNAYDEDFERTLLQNTQSYYSIQSSKWIAEDSCPDYMKKTEEKLESEERRATAYLHTNTKPKLISKVQDELIRKHQTTLLNMDGSGLVALLKTGDKHEDLSRMYTLFDRIESLQPMSEKLRDFITEEGVKIHTNQCQQENIDAKGYIEELLKLHLTYSKLVNIQFKQNPLFLDALRDAFTHFVNLEVVSPGDKNRSTTAELISTYCDSIMKEVDKVGEENLDELLENIVKLFGYLKDKDMFLAFYREHLSKRLLVASRLNLDAERNFIGKLKMRMGMSFTQKLEGMIKDKSISENLRNDFKNYTTNKSITLPFDFNPEVLTLGCWPQMKIDKMTIPQELSVCLDTFKKFYDSITQQRKLDWIHSLGTAIVTGRFSAGTKEISTNTYQACILLLFNNQAEMTFQDIQNSLNLPPTEIKRNLLSLCATKAANLLSTDGNKKAVNPTDKFTVNADFESPQRRIKIPNVVVHVTQQQKQDISQKAQEERKYVIDAALVRIMKTRKILKYQELMTETIKQLSSHFQPDPKLIKRRVEDLIAREYLERDAKDSSTIQYVA
ncbi:predicted protein [Naegleria gruberi]|uniref:Predicted protein n=1 Tax=Naegleria gruberi TaxID=5762 RepID=D2VT99_NAEGR|nr:uncharacterized protein NAEGRDRAFT_81152 [Naegleria gruberi]EFC39897.1 predicted protein [Naegleria gruberi]|eukprot:XP_002672641.1 predicted protein [Naegleria gruberi strain NEG-M]